jgi:hypothetical protein
LRISQVSPSRAFFTITASDGDVGCLFFQHFTLPALPIALGTAIFAGLATLAGLEAGLGAGGGLGALIVFAIIGSNLVDPVLKTDQLLSCKGAIKRKVGGGAISSWGGFG